jgi:rhamnogalacturonyl hydrolase YesR
LGVRAGEVAPTARPWGEEIQSKIDSAFWMAGKNVYALEAGNGKGQRPAWIWDGSIELGALCAAARVEPAKYLPRVRAYATGIRAYRTTYKGRPGLDVNPPPKPSDRYYDDNAWISMSLLEAYRLTKDPRDLQLAREAYEFALSGEDASNLGGGIYWHEDQTKSKNACSSGPVMVAAMMFYQQTGDKKFLETAKRLYDWTRKTLQDPEDGLVYDHISVPDGKVNRGKLTYNAGTLIRGAAMLYRATKDRAYLDEARRVAGSAEKRFVRGEDGIVTGWGKLGVKLIEGFLELASVDEEGGAHWKEVVGRAVSALHHQKNAQGWYGLDWHKGPPAEGAVVRLIDQGAVARAYWVAAEAKVEVKE